MTIKKLYRDTTLRIAKKKIGKWHWKKLQAAVHLKRGDLISTCKGYNERIVEIEPEWSRYGLSKGQFIYDFSIISESGGSCSLIHCCTIPLETKQEIINYWWNNWASDEALAALKEHGGGWYEINIKSPIVQGLRAGKDVFDEDGQPFFEFCSEFEKQARFPERYEEWKSQTKSTTKSRKKSSKTTNS